MRLLGREEEDGDGPKIYTSGFGVECAIVRRETSPPVGLYLEQSGARRSGLRGVRGRGRVGRERGQGRRRVIVRTGRNANE